MALAVLELGLPPELMLTTVIEAVINTSPQHFPLSSAKSIPPWALHAHRPSNPGHTSVPFQPNTEKRH
ncbi:hypothetical protein D9619_013569 [Psilocybe cf. subviscida]|uniref:Uncharacterized protein n=1 Tax=Psilocybe cf. subviscida TaxID=2480587 RepID=A0A8H5APZ7_9AGAR|nr:hypothetical protein D9619_013569 [Psilocybe cf. subviscida]